MTSNATLPGESSHDTRLFVPLKTEHYQRFESGEKDVELRGINDQFNRDAVTVGRRVELRRGYSTDDSLFGTVYRVWTSDSLDELVDDVGHTRINPSLGFDDVVAQARDLLADYDQYIAFHVDLDQPSRVECTVCGALVGRGPGGLGISQHANRHRREYREKFGEPPDDYQELRDAFQYYTAADDDQQMTLAEAVDERARSARRDDDQAAIGGDE